jgi:hypothetical protein
VLFVCDQPKGRPVLGSRELWGTAFPTPAEASVGRHTLAVCCGAVVYLCGWEEVLLQGRGQVAGRELWGDSPHLSMLCLACL